MAILPAYPLPTPGTTLNSVADPELLTALQGVLAGFNGSIDFANLSGALQSTINSGTAGPRASVSIPASESRTNVAYGTLTTPDQVTGLVLPTNGLLVVGYQATWQNSVGNAGQAAIFLGANQVVASDGGHTTPQAQAATCTSTAATNVPLASSDTGLFSTAGGGVAYAGDATTGQVLTAGTANGGPCFIFAAAGTYTVSVQFKASSGSVTASNRTLRVMVQAFS